MWNYLDVYFIFLCEIDFVSKRCSLSFYLFKKEFFIFVIIIKFLKKKR